VRKFGLTWKPPIEAVLTMWAGLPEASMRGTSAWMPWMTPYMLTPITQSQSAAVISCSGTPCMAMPALLQPIEIGP
jgi:hypothetical protein